MCDTVKPRWLTGMVSGRGDVVRAGQAVAGLEGRDEDEQNQKRRVQVEAIRRVESEGRHARSVTLHVSREIASDDGGGVCMDRLAMGCGVDGQCAVACWPTTLPGHIWGLEPRGRSHSGDYRTITIVCYMHAGMSPPGGMAWASCITGTAGMSHGSALQANHAAKRGRTADEIRQAGPWRVGW